MTIPTFSPRQPEQRFDSLARFLRGLQTKKIHLSDVAAGDLLTIAQNGGLIVGTKALPGDYSFTGSVSFSGAQVTIGADDIVIDSQGAMFLRASGFLDLYATEDSVVLLRLVGVVGGVSRYLGFNPDAITDGATRLLRAQDLAGTMPVVGDDAPAVAAGSLGKVDLTAQTANIAATALSNTPPAGLYWVEAYILTTTADAAAGTQAVTLAYTDAVGATTATLVAAHNLAATGRSTGRQLVQLASGNLVYAVTNTGGYGTAAYAIYVRVFAAG